MKLEILNFDIERDLEGSGNQFFYKIFEIQMGLMRFGTYEKHIFSESFKNPNGPDKVWKGLKTSFLQNFSSLNGAEKIWKALKTRFYIVSKFK